MKTAYSGGYCERFWTDLRIAAEAETKGEQGTGNWYPWQERVWEGTLAGAVSYPYDQLERGTARLPKNRKLILYCDHGGGSMQMARMLGEQGYHVASVVGGYEAMKKISKNYFKNRENM